jgi:nitroreductase
MDLTTILKGRRSIRKYKPDPVPRETLEEILSAAFWAPTGMNLQNWDVVVVGGKTRDRIAQAVASAKPRIEPGLREFLPEKIVKFSMMFFENFGDAPILILVYVPKIPVSIDAGMSNEEVYDRERRRFTSHLSGAALAQNILILAYDKGLGTCWMTDPKRAEHEINAILGIEDKELVACIPVGYPDQDPPAPPRKEKVQWVDL